MWSNSPCSLGAHSCAAHSGSSTHETFCLGNHLRRIGHFGRGRAKDCEELRKEIEVNIQAKAIPSYTLEIITAEEAKNHDEA